MMLAHSEEREQRFAAVEALLETIPDPVLLVDRSGLVLEANGAARALFPTLSVGRPLAYAIRDPEILDPVAAALGLGKAVDVEYRARVPLERAFAVRIAGLPGSGGDQRANSAVALFFRALTEARRLERMRVDFVA